VADFALFLFSTKDGCFFFNGAAGLALGFGAGYAYSVGSYFT
jgi:hypothetical protein